MLTLADAPLRNAPVVEPSTTLDEVVRLMESDPLRTVALVGDGMYFGLFNDASLQGNLIPPDIDFSTLEVGPYIHSERVIGTPEMTIDNARALMDRRNVRVIPLVANRIFKGLITREDLG